MTNAIGWCDITVNPIRRRIGGHYCEKISAGCAKCYASRLQPRLNGEGYKGDTHGHPRVSDVYLDGDVLASVLRMRKPRRIFWCSMTDLFGSWVPDEWIAACFAVMAATPQHAHLVLTKRPERTREWYKWLPQQTSAAAPFADDVCRLMAWNVASLHVPSTAPVNVPFPNVHLGVSVEDQPTADARIPILLDIPAAVRWVSYEPALGPVDFWPMLITHMRNGIDRDPIDWLVVGGESGPGARPCDVAWIRSAVEQCRKAGVPVWVKQLGARPVAIPRAFPPAVTGAPEGFPLNPIHRSGSDPAEWPADLRVRELPRCRHRERGGAPRLVRGALLPRPRDGFALFSTTTEDRDDGEETDQGRADGEDALATRDRLPRARGAPDQARGRGRPDRDRGGSRERR